MYDSIYTRYSDFVKIFGKYFNINDLCNEYKIDTCLSLNKNGTVMLIKISFNDPVLKTWFLLKYNIEPYES